MFHKTFKRVLNRQPLGCKLEAQVSLIILDNHEKKACAQNKSNFFANQTGANEMT
jgi:hypothetical protein